MTVVSNEYPASSCCCLFFCSADWLRKHRDPGTRLTKLHDQKKRELAHAKLNGGMVQGQQHLWILTCTLPFSPQWWSRSHG